MNVFRYIFLILLLMTMSEPLFAQHSEEDKCGTMAADAALRRKFPQLGPLDDFEKHLQRKIAERKALEQSGRMEAAVITIPVIVHVVHNGESVGAGANISGAQITAQLNTLNDDFRNRNIPSGDNWASRRADIEIEFCTAIINPNGQPMTEKGIERLNGGRANWDRDAMENYKAQTIWNPDKYYNIWVFNIASTGSSQLLGYAQFPFNSTLSGLGDSRPSANTDGVIVASQAFGGGRRTLTHETGHWLGLRHIWGDANCGNDYCDDTPPAAEANTGCPTGKQSCGAGNTNMVENYMDYTSDGCMNIFTRDQKTRMRTVMEFADRRATLLQSDVCGSVVAGPLAANFVADKFVTLLNTEIQFTDRSSGNPTSWLWTFPGGKPETSTARNPVVTYEVAGKYAVTLTVRKENEGNTLTRPEYIEVLAGGTCNEDINFTGSAVLLRDAASGKGYISGQNGRKITAISEFFENKLGYTSMSGTSIHFGKAFVKDGANSEATVNVTVWNARGYQGGPGTIVEVKQVPLRTILADVAANRRTEVVFDREVPLFGRPYHVGIELKYQGDSLAIHTTKDGIKGTAWEQDQTGEWDLYLRRNGLVVAHDISTYVGIKPSVNLSTDKLFIYPGEAVTLQASGAGIYYWSPETNLNTALGPQVVARPSQNTTYKVKGSGADMCLDSATVTIFVRNVTVTGNEPVAASVFDNQVTVNPNPGTGYFEIAVDNAQSGELQLKLYNISGVTTFSGKFYKSGHAEKFPLDIRHFNPGIYILEVRSGELVTRKRIVKL